MTMKSRTSVCITRHFNVSPERLFDAWTDPERAWKWIARAAGEVVRVEVDPRVHGAVRHVVRRDGREIEHRGEYTELARPDRLTFTWNGPPFPNEAGPVRLAFMAAGTGTDLILAHERVPQGHESRTMHGWSAI